MGAADVTVLLLFFAIVVLYAAALAALATVTAPACTSIKTTDWQTSSVHHPLCSDYGSIYIYIFM